MSKPKGEKIRCPLCEKSVARIGLPAHTKTVHGKTVKTPKQNAILCPYCAGPAKLVKGSDLYPHLPELADKRFWRCDPCEAHVGVHEGTLTPLGRLANAQLRRWKIKAHDAFDPIWNRGKMRRHAAYKWLSEQLGIPREQAHIGMFDVNQCKAVITACAKRESEAQPA